LLLAGLDDHARLHHHIKSQFIFPSIYPQKNCA